MQIIINIKGFELGKGILNFVLIGAKNTGKTTYLSHLIKGNEVLTPCDKETIIYLNDNNEDIETKGQVEATEAMHKVLSFNYNYKDTKGTEFSIEDYDGNFAETVLIGDNETKKEREKLKNNIHNAEGCIFLFPYEKDISRLKKFATEIAEFINFAKVNTLETDSQSPIPATIMVTKWDESEYFKAKDEQKRVLEYIQKNEILNIAMQNIKNNFKNTQVIPVSSKYNYNMLLPINFSLNYTFEYWYEEAKKYKANNKKKFIKFLNDIQYDTKSHSKFHDFNIERQKENKKENRKNIFIVISVCVIIFVVGSFYSNNQTMKNQKIWMDNTTICLDNCKGESGLATIDNFRKEAISFKSDAEIDKRVKDLVYLENKIIIKLGLKDSAIKLKDTVNIEEIVNMSEDAFILKAMTSRHVLSLYPNYFNTQKGEALLESLKKSIIEKDFKEILDGDIQLFIELKNKFTKIIYTIENSSNINDIINIDYTKYSRFEDSDRIFIINHLDSKINIFLKDLIEERPRDKFNILELEIWLKNINKIRNFKLEDIGYIFTLLDIDNQIISQIEKDLTTIKNLTKFGISNILVTIVGYENNLLEFECSIFGEDSIIISGFSQTLDYNEATQCENNLISFDTKITVKAKQYNASITEENTISDNKNIKKILSFKIEELYKLQQNKTIIKNMDMGKIELRFKKVAS